MIFDAKKLRKLNNPERAEWIPFDKLRNALGLESPEVLVDFGAGTGFFTAPLARDEPGIRFYALDVQQEMISYLKKEMPSNVEAVLIDGKRISLEENGADGLICINVYHEIPERDVLLTEFYRVLKPRGVLLVIDWEKENPILKDGPPLERRVAASDMVQEMAEAGFREIEPVYGFNSHTALRAVKPD